MSLQLPVILYFSGNTQITRSNKEMDQNHGQNSSWTIDPKAWSFSRHIYIRIPFMDKNPISTEIPG